MAGNLKNRAAKGVLWSAIERFSYQGIQFVLSFVIARQLLPQDYALIAMLAIFMAVAQSFIDSGFSNALIQKQNRTKEDLSTVFYFNIAVGVLMYLVLLVLSPWIASFYNQPVLKVIIVWVGLNLIISSFSAVQRSLLIIDLNFRKQSIISICSVSISGAVAVCMAYNNYGVWTLVVQSLLNALINTILLWVTSSWMPSLIFSKSSFKELFSFGSKLLFGGLLHTVYMNL
jgi:O-antigen/teichoic acid export membrane protein